MDYSIWIRCLARRCFSIRRFVIRRFVIRRFAIRCITIRCIALLIAASAGLADAEVQFNRDVRPILSDKCFFCHGPDREERQADLRLDVHDGPMGAFTVRGKKNTYAAIVPGKPDESRLIERIMDPDDPMPPADSHKKLSPEEANILRQWVAEGAAYEAAWAYVPPRQQAVSKSDTWPAANDIDHLVYARLKSAGLKPSSDADSITLVRRLYFDLTGLPPTPVEVREFVSSDDPQRYAKLVDRLLESPRFGERMAVYWLDLVRYADTVGYHGDQVHNASLYRDYVIRAFNSNLPFDQFTKEQLAGDLLESPTKWQRIASGYNRLLQTSHEGGIQRKEYLAIYAADRVRNVSGVWMGATIGCAQCHDHKYDPYTIEDFYSMAAFFSDLHDADFTGNSNPTRRPPEEKFLSDTQEDELKALDKELDSILPREVREQLVTNRAKLQKLSSVIAVRKQKAKQQAKQKKNNQDGDKQGGKDNSIDELIREKEDIEQTISKAASEEARKRVSKLEAARKRLLDTQRTTMITVAKVPMMTRVLPRGDWLDDSGAEVQPAVPGFLGKIETAKDQASRLDLANWLTDLDEGVGSLTARVFANRVWYLFFGSGISRSLDDFGGQGQPPANPELLDHLAVQFYENGWDVKQLVRYIVNSRSYRQSSLETRAMRDRDPLNQMVDRQARFRIPAEAVRDQALLLGGLLVEKTGGNSVRPYQPKGYYRHLNFPVRKYAHDTDERQYRRGVYTHWQRQFLHPMLRAFDAPTREECTAERPRSNTPIAALVALNDPTFVEAARAFAARTIQAAESNNDRIDFAFEQATSRKPTIKEKRVLETILQNAVRTYDSSPDLVENLGNNGMWQAPENIPAKELATWTHVTRTLLNLNETITRN